jgi:uncharacterized protein YaeQ
MALKATIFKISLQIADLDRGYYQNHDLTLARHPSETDERMMVRVLAFASHASDGLVFCRGLSTDDEPDLWRKSLTDDIELWIDVGLPDERRIRKACNRARQVAIYCYGGRSANLWWHQIKDKTARFDNLSVINLPYADTQLLAAMVQRSLAVQCTIQDGQLWVSTDTANLGVTPERWWGNTESSNY